MTRHGGITTGPSRPRPDPGEAVCTSVSLLMLRWQASAAPSVFETLVSGVRLRVERVVRRVLRRSGVRDPDAVEDAVSLVLDHLRRLSGSQGGERRVAMFTPAPARPDEREPADLGLLFISCLAADRARDVVRARRRQRSVPLSQLGVRAAHAIEHRLAASRRETGGPPPIDRVRAAAVRLEPRLQLLVELLLEGKSQTVIAHVLGVCEGTVSRLRGRAIAALRRLLAE